MKNFFLRVLHSVVVIFIVSWIIFAATSISLDSWDTITKSVWDEVVNKLNSSSWTWESVPSWAVMAFNLSSCPSSWSEYTPAQWRVIRWIDKTGTSIDPDGERALESTQEDAIRNLTWYMTSRGTSWSQSSIPYVDGSLFSYEIINSTPTSLWFTGWSVKAKNVIFDASRVVPTAEENRMKNVALLYCVKD